MTDGLQEDTPGFWVSQASSAVSYPEDGHATCRDIEDESFWFEHRNDCITTVVRRFPPPGPVVDIGAGNGVVARAIQREGHPVVVLEPGEQGAREAYGRGLRPVIAASLADARFRRAVIAAAGLFDVVEHVEDDVAFLRDLSSAMQPGGRLYLTVPAYKGLWSVEDVTAGHWRRYTAPGLRKTLQSAGFEVEYDTFFFSFLVAPIFVMRAIPSALRLRRATPDIRPAEHRRPGGPAGRVLDALCRRERKALRDGRISFGSSLLMVAKLPS